MKPELKPCPFCGAWEVVMEESRGPLREYHFVRCHACESNGRSAWDEETAAANWNRRFAAISESSLRAPEDGKGGKP